MTDAGSSVLGATLEPLSQAEMSSMNINYGVKVTDMGEGRFKDIGMTEGYIILSVNGMKVRSAEDINEITNNGESLKSISGIQPDGSILKYEFGK
jgi:S1-C subfamily serine protease